MCNRYDLSVPLQILLCFTFIFFAQSNYSFYVISASITALGNTKVYFKMKEKKEKKVEQNICINLSILKE